MAQQPADTRDHRQDSQWSALCTLLAFFFGKIKKTTDGQKVVVRTVAITRQLFGFPGGSAP